MSVLRLLPLPLPLPVARMGGRGAQQCAVLARGGLHAEMFGGASTHASWSAVQWHERMAALQVMVMTPGLFLATLMHGFLKVLRGTCMHATPHGLAVQVHVGFACAWQRPFHHICCH